MPRTSVFEALAEFYGFLFVVMYGLSFKATFLLFCLFFDVARSFCGVRSGCFVCFVLALPLRWLCTAALARARAKDVHEQIA